MTVSESNSKSTPAAYYALALQTACHAVSAYKDVEAARNRILENIGIVSGQIASSKAFIGKDCRLVVLPEYCLTGFPMGDSVAAWIEKACIREESREFEALQTVAQENDIYLCINAYECEREFPELFFQACLIFDPGGRLILRYRRLNSMFSPTPHDVWHRFRQTHDLDDIFPVARTPIGNLAAVASEEILFPEVSRCLALRGAEILLHPTSQSNESARPVKDTASKARAFENMAYVVSANSGGIYGTRLPASSADGGSKIIDFHGQVICRSGGGESMTACAEIDLAALKRYRRRPGMGNMLSRQRLELYSETYAMEGFYPPNTLEGRAAGRDVFIEAQLETIRRLAKAEII